MAGVTDGVELVQRLKASGTGEAKLKVCRDALEVAKAENRRPSSSEVIAVLAAAGDVIPPLTLEKAKAIADTGDWVSRVSASEVAIEDSFPIEIAIAPPLNLSPTAIMDALTAPVRGEAEAAAKEAASDPLGPPENGPIEIVAPVKVNNPSAPSANGPAGKRNR